MVVTQWAENEVEQMTNHLQSMIQARSDAIVTRLDDILGKIDNLEERFDEEMTKIPIDIERRGEELSKMLVSQREKEVQPSGSFSTGGVSSPISASPGRQ